LVGNRYLFFRHLTENSWIAEGDWGITMPRIRPKMTKKIKRRPISRGPGRPVKPGPRLSRSKARAVPDTANEIVRTREAPFRLLFDSNPVPMIVCALDDERILGVNDAAVEHYGYSRAEFEKLTIRSIQAFESELPWAGDHSSDELTARTWKHVRADGTLIDLA